MNKRKALSGERIEKKQSEVKQQKIKEIEAQKENNEDLNQAHDNYNADIDFNTFISEIGPKKKGNERS